MPPSASVLNEATGNHAKQKDGKKLPSFVHPKIGEESDLELRDKVSEAFGNLCQLGSRHTGMVNPFSGLLG